jgi:hypothetical protein
MLTAATVIALIALAYVVGRASRHRPSPKGVVSLDAPPPPIVDPPAHGGYLKDFLD